MSVRETSANAVAEDLRRVAEALERAGRPGTPPALARQLEREAARIAVGHPEPEAVAAAIEPATLGALCDRLAAELDGQRALAWDVLDLVRRSAFLRRIPPAEVAAWSDRILALVDASHFTVGPLFRHRAERYAYKPLFEVPRPGGSRSITWLQAASRVDFLARGLVSLDTSDAPAPIAILSDNSLEMALADLACLSSGLVDVMIPANSTEADVGFMLRHSGAGTVLVSGKAQLKKVLPHRDQLPALRRIVTLGPLDDRPDRVLGVDELMARAVHIPGSLVAQRSEATRIDDLATIMYTSGTTGVPKGIRFSHRNLVFKRFARALALPEIGEDDVFVCFLPLYHTFGRFLEMMGCVFWGATYVFLENPSIGTLIQGMRHHRPSVFISVPKKWIELYEAVARKADPQTAPDDELREATRSVVGDRLRWGLSAAGYLDSEIFRFFQRQGVELMSGFGMTEATGGITMTPPGEYRDDSLGLPLPGIETRLADDGELKVRGPYVMLGYLDPPEGERSFDDEGWFRTGDLMEKDRAGHIRLVDRKKEIYKNVKGETIAPQRIENLFRDFASVGRVFLVGDHKPYNTLLLYPNPAYKEIDFSAMAPSEVREHFRSLVVSVNKFLAPYERVVDFAIIDRDLDADRGELTPKGSPRRKRIADNFADTIRTLYRRTNLSAGGAELTFPNWLFQALGLTAQDIELGDGTIRILSRGTALTVRRIEPGRTQVGDFVYRHGGGALNLGSLLTTPRLWLGNGELVEFLPLSLTARQRTGRTGESIAWDGYARPQDATAIETPAAVERPDLLHLHAAAQRLAASDAAEREAAVGAMRDLIGLEIESLVEPARIVLARAACDASDAVARAAIQALAPHESDSRIAQTRHLFHDARPRLLGGATGRALSDDGLSEPKLLAVLQHAQAVCMAPEVDVAAAGGLLEFVAVYGSDHPTSYRRIRAFLSRVGLFAPSDALRERAADCSRSLRDGFRAWLGGPDRIAVDPETRAEYRWDDVVEFDADVPQPERERLMGALRTTPLLREGVFLFSFGAAVRLSDIPRPGVFLRRVGSRHGKSVFRMTVQTRYQGAFELAVNVNLNMPDAAILEEIRLLILCGDPGAPTRLVEEFGGYYPDYDLWTEEFITGETLDKALDRLSRQSGGRERLRDLWPFLAWSALSAYVDFWHRSGRRWEITAAQMANVIVPTQDYQTGARLVSLYDRRRHASVGEMIRGFRDNFVASAEQRYPELRGLIDWPLIFASLLEVVGEDEGLALLRAALAEAGARSDPALSAAFEKFRASVESRGFLPLRLYFAAKRYRRWAELSAGATLQARARTLQGLYETYGLERLTDGYPEVRARFFRETVFRDAPAPLAEGLEELIQRMRSGELPAEEMIDAVADLRSRIDLGPDDDYFLARISFPYLRPEDAAGYVSSFHGGRPQSEMVVAIEDSDSNAYRVRHALNPKEIERLHRLFVAARLDIRFRPEHQYLVVLNDRSQIIGGLFYEIAEDGETAHLEKIVVGDPFRGKGIAEALMQEFFNRLRATGLKAVTTGFFRPEYFSSYGFRIEKKYAGLVKSLTESA